MTGTPRERLLRLTRSVEELPLGLGGWLLFLGAIIVLRHFLEQVSGQTKTMFFVSYFIHYPLAYIAPLLALSVILALFARERIERVTKLMLFAWLLTLLPPLIDLLLLPTRENPEIIGYLIPKSGTLWAAFVNLLNPLYHEFQGTTAGIRIEAGLGCVLAAVYIHLKTAKMGRSILGAAVVYVTMFFFFALPPITLAVANLFGAGMQNVFGLFLARADVHRAFVNATPFALSDLSNSLIDLLVVAPLLAVWFRIYDRDRFSRLLRSVDAVRILYHLLVVFAGMILGARLLLGSRGLLSVSHPFDVVSIVGVFAATLFTAVAAGALGRLHDPAAKHDGLTPDRETLLMCGTFSFALAALFALSVSYVALTYVLSVLAVYYLYYATPFRLMRFTPLAGFLIGAVTFFSLELGYSTYAGGSAALWLPRSLITISLLVPTLAFLARDVWSPIPPDSAGFNLKSILGEERARIVAGLAVLVASLVPSAALGMPVLAIPGIIVGTVAFRAVTRIRIERMAPALGSAAVVLAAACLFMGADRSLTLRLQLDDTGFSAASRRQGSYEIAETEGATEEQRLANEGTSLFRRGEYEEAVELYRRAIEVNPDYAHAYVGLGSAYMRLKRLPEAERAFRRAIDLDPENAMARVGLAQVQGLYDRPEEALAELEKAVEIDPENVDALYTMALAHRELGDLPSEIEALELTVALDPGHGPALTRLADLYMSRQMYAQAVEVIESGLRERARIENAHLKLAQAHYAMGDLEAAEDELRNEILVRPKSSSAHANLARLLVELERYPEAAQAYERAISYSMDPALTEFLERELSSLPGR